MDQTSLRALLEQYQPIDLQEQTFREQMQALWEQGDQACSRRNLSPGHFTASAFVISPDRQRVALIAHPKLKRWLQPGGHIEAEDSSAEAAARREVLEELGISEIEFKKLAKHSRYIFCQSGSPVFHVKYGKNQANPYQRGLWVDDLSKLAILRKGNFRQTNFGDYILEGAFRIHPPANNY